MVADLLDWLDATGPWSALELLPLFILLNFLGLPATLLASVTGYFTRPLVAIPLVLLARSVAALLSWFAGRRLLARRWREALAHRPRLEALDRALGDGGIRSVILVRLVPSVPSTVTSFGFGLTRVRPGALFLGTLIGTLPNTVIAVLLGASIEDLAHMDEGRSAFAPAFRLLLVLGLAALLLLARGLLKGRPDRRDDPT
ncbi:MAG: VTT domain-containing protein [Planctomycetes bacterium]|nr:VTT domain-containing protein [Planctomycetota bacterium]